MLPHRRWLSSSVAHITFALVSTTSVVAFDDREFCVAAKQFALAAEQDVGLWLDRVTRSAGLTVSCDKKVVEFKRFTYAPSSSMTADWKQRKAAEWNGTHCTSQLWNEAVFGGWKIVLSVTAADGGNALFSAECK